MAGKILEGRSRVPVFVAFALTTFALLPAECALARHMGAFPSYDYAPSPKLMAPAGEEVNLTGEDFLEFKWSTAEGDTFARDHYDFRLYKGYDTTASNLILKEAVSYNTGALKVPSDTFQDGQVYTWSLRQVYDTGKSDPSFSSFRVIKK